MTLGPQLGVTYNSICHCISTIIRYEGLGALYKGFCASLLYGAPYVGVQMTLLELLLRKAPVQAGTGLLPAPVELVRIRVKTHELHPSRVPPQLLPMSSGNPHHRRGIRLTRGIRRTGQGA